MEIDSRMEVDQQVKIIKEEVSSKSNARLSLEFQWDSSPIDVQFISFAH